MLGFVHVVGATLRETTRSSQGKPAGTNKPVQVSGKSAKAKA